MPNLNFAAARTHFPALQRLVNGQPVIHADNPGGTQVPRAVAEAVSDYLLHRNANTHGAFLTSQLTDETIAAARTAMADLLNAPSSDEIVFGLNMTTLTFALSRALGRTLRSGDEIVVTTLDHDANFSPWATLSEQGATIRQAGIRPDDVTLDLDDWERYLNHRTRLVALGHASNAVGTISPVRTMVERVRALAPNALVFVDAVQSVPHLPVDVQALGCDLLACSSYKFFGPHQGILWGRSEVLERLPAYKVRPADDRAPDRWETGTKSHEGMAGVTAAVDYLASLAPAELGTGERRARLRAAMEGVQAHEQTLSYHLLRGLSTLPGARVYGIADVERLDERVPTVALTMEGHTAQQLAEALAQQGIFAWSGHYYALNLMEALGLQPHGALRLGLAHYNTPDEVERIVAALALIPAQGAEGR